MKAECGWWLHCLVVCLGLAAVSCPEAGPTYCAVGEIPCAEGCCDLCWADGAWTGACIDDMPPKIAIDDTGSEWRAAAPVLTLSVGDRESGIDFARFWWDDDLKVDFTDGDTTAIPSDGVHVLAVEAGDVAGNVTDPSTTFTYRLCSAAGWYVSSGDECVAAEPGYFSPAGALARYPCPPNHSSGPGAGICTLTCLDAPVVFAYTGAEVAWQVPDDCDVIEIKVWGSGGGRADWGGPGGFSQAALTVSPGETIAVRVGGREQVFGGGAGSAGSTGPRQGGNGGDYSGVFRGSVPLIMAGGGGGGAASPHVDVGRSGAGGGVAGGGGTMGGTQTEPGTGVFGASGSAHNGGDADYGTTGVTFGGGGGGGGYFGGAGGHAGDSWGTGGGAGSGYAPSGGTTLQGAGAEPPMTSDLDYADNAGAPDTNGRIVIRRGS